MKEVYSKIVQFRGSHYDFGYAQGVEMRDSLLVQNREKQWKLRKPRFSVEEREVQEAITRFAPGVWDELIGLRDALGWSMERVLMEFGGYRLDYVKSGCSILTGEDYLVRNYDYHPKTYEGRFVLYQPTDQGYAIMGPSQRVTGRMDGMNEKGLAIGYNFMHRKKPGIGFICCMIGRLVLESCANVDEAVSMLKEIPHRHSFSYIVFDSSGETYIIETSPRGVEVRQDGACTNHFERMQGENRNYLDDSYRRLGRMKEARPQLTNAADAFRLLNDEDQGVFSKQYRNWAGTIHTSLYFPKKLTAWFAIGENKEPYELDFESWLSGNTYPLSSFTGKVDTDLGFPHMDSNTK
ncbi:choloylglycine hydrolase [Pontibacillus halophilus JSM 076056 = DSM 19796]|uniref:Choloylglycine hydrolase n=1 Tax=Pontibacillus halophilus JSM 076056 = DSM 19796 TaxID=1385510 RepID=A0A0A5GIG1_9BACI|nr:C45 family peptidase [Pontibacillus halophilus]KGX93011.1 choloylglycine hydrolase [Pontibacillus halophilus JSM 076056 = DSM 19796]